MSETAPQAKAPQPNPPKHWWQGLPAILTGLAAVITALTGLVVSLQGNDPGGLHDPATRQNAGVVAPAPAAPAQPPSTALPRADRIGSSTARPADKGRLAFIDDPDGYTNVRAAPNGNARILARVVDDEPFRVLAANGKWWQVRTAAGEIGYMHRSRIRLATE